MYRSEGSSLPEHLAVDENDDTFLKEGTVFIAPVS